MYGPYNGIDSPRRTPPNIENTLGTPAMINSLIVRMVELVKIAINRRLQLFIVDKSFQVLKQKIFRLV